MANGAWLMKTLRRTRLARSCFWSVKAAAMILLSCLPSNAVGAQSRIKDIARIAGLEDIPLLGYGVVVGLNGTGDKDIELTKQTMANLFENFKISLPVDDIKSKNVAAAVLTASAPPFHREGDRIDVTVSSLGDATSLSGGTLLMTVLLDPNGGVYALAQGNLTVGGFSVGAAGDGGKTIEKNHTTTAIVPGGAALKHGQNRNFCKNGIMRLLLRHPDFTTADRMATAINQEFGGLAVARDAATVAVKIPRKVMDIGQAASFVARLEKLSLTPDMRAKVIVNERTGTIVMGNNVHISQAVVAHGNLTVTIKSTLYPSHPSNLVLIGGTNVASEIRSLETPDVKVRAVEDKARVMLVPRTTTVRELADTLNLMGATPRDLISILEALHRLGAIQMELTAM